MSDPSKESDDDTSPINPLLSNDEQPPLNPTAPSVSDPLLLLSDRPRQAKTLAQAQILSQAIAERQSDDSLFDFSSPDDSPKNHSRTMPNTQVQQQQSTGSVSQQQPQATGSTIPNFPDFIEPNFSNASEITRLIRHDFSGNPEELQPFLDDCKLASTWCPKEHQGILFVEIVSHITKAARAELAGRRDITTYEALASYLLRKYKYQYTFAQLCDQLSSISQKPSEDSDSYAGRIRHLIWKIKEASATEGESATYTAKLTEQLALNRFKNHSLPEMSRFLRIKDVDSFDEAVQEALEEERQTRKNPEFSKKYCSFCKLSNHNTNDCRKKGMKPYKPSITCTYCKINGHHTSECRKKAFNDRQKIHSAPSVRSIQCNYCKKFGHIVKECRKLKFRNDQLEKESKDLPQKDILTKASNPEVRKSVRTLTNVLLLNSTTRLSSYVFLSSDFTKKSTLPYLIDTGAEISIIAVEDLLYEKLEHLNPSETTVISGIDGNITCLGTIFLPFKFPTGWYDFKFHVVRQQDIGNVENGILGNNILSSTHADIKHSDMLLALTTLNEELPISYTKTPSPLLRKIAITDPVSTQEPPLVEQPKIVEINREEQLLSKIRIQHLEKPVRETIQKILLSYPKNFQLANDPLTLLPNSFQHEIYLSNDKPIYVKNYRFPVSFKDEVERQTLDLLKRGIIVHSKSPWNFPIWIVSKKKDASNEIKWRMVIDYRKLNEVTIDDKYPLPNIEEILENLGDAKYFSSIDLANGFHQVAVRDCDQEKTAFSTHQGHFEFTRMPFGLKNAPATFQRMINTIFADFINHFVFVYLDDIIIYSPTIELHYEYLQKVFNLIKENNLQVQLDKSEFLQNQIVYLGHTVSSRGVQPNPEKIRAICNYPPPKDVTELQRFLGMAGYYRRFIPNYATLMKPLTQLLRKSVTFNWNDACQTSFAQLLDLMSSELLLTHPDYSKPFILNCDASNYAIGAVLQQRDANNHLRPLGFASRTLNDAETRYSTIEKETLAIVWSVKHFRHYLFGRRFAILSDHKPLIWLFKISDPSSRLLRWRLKLEEYDFTISHIPGTQNVVADSLSRIPQIAAITRSQATLSQIDQPKPKHSVKSKKLIEPFPEIDITLANNLLVFTTVDTFSSSPLTRDFPFQVKKDEIIFHKIHRKLFILVIYKQNRQDPFLLQSFIQLLQTLHLSLMKEKIHEASIYEELNDFDIKKKFVIETLLHENLPNIKLSWLLIGEIPQNKKEILVKFHEHILTGHPGSNRLYNVIRENGYYWFGMKTDIRDFLKTCDQCQKIKIDRHPTKVPMVITDTAKEPLEKISMDIVGPLPLTISGNRFILSLQDHLTKFLFLKAMPQHTAETVAKNLLTFFASFGLPKTLLSDQGTEFRSQVITKLTNDFGISHIFCSPYHPESNGALERSHSTIKEYLKFYVNTDKDNWDDFLDTAIFSFNNSVHSATNFTPFELMFGRKIIINTKNKTYDDHLSNLLQTFKNTHAQACENIIQKKIKSKKKYDESHSSDFRFYPGQFALLRDMLPTSAKKLAPTFKGPYLIKQIAFPNVILDINGQEKSYHSKLLKPYISP